MSRVQELFSFDGKMIIITRAAGAICRAAGHLIASLGARISLHATQRKRL